MTQIVPPTDAVAAPPPPRRRRLVLLACGISMLFFIGAFGIHKGVISAPIVLDMVERAGPWGFVVFVALFVVGNLMHLPGALFITAAAFCYGPWVGTGVSVVAGTIGATVNFLVVRRVGGRSVAAFNYAWVVRALQTIEARPFRTVLILRLVFFTSPTLSALLGLTPVSTTVHASASFLGMMPMVFVVSQGVDALLF